MILYHGSRGGIVGEIKPQSRIRCDFGAGFYMGTNPDQAKSLVANDQAPYFYTLDLDLEPYSSDRVLRLFDMDWAYFVLFNRGRLDSVKGSPLYNKCAHLADGKDFIIGAIADDAMNEAMNRFIRGDITDKAFLESIRGLNYGVQYVAKTEIACSSITILKETELFGKELTDALSLLNERRIKGGQIARKMQRKYRREGKYFDELLAEIEKSFKRDVK